MAVSILATVHSNYECDACKTGPTNINPIIIFQQGTRTDRNIIYIHNDCLQKKLTKALKNISA